MSTEFNPSDPVAPKTESFVTLERALRSEFERDHEFTHKLTCSTDLRLSPGFMQKLSDFSFNAFFLKEHFKALFNSLLMTPVRPQNCQDLLMGPLVRMKQKFMIALREFSLYFTEGFQEKETVALLKALDINKVFEERYGRLGCAF